MTRVTLLSDFGTADGYVAAMKGVLADGAPGVLLDDVAHDLAPGDVSAAARALGRYWRRYPAGTVHLVVVDPGVGTARLPLALEADGRFVVGPDNGLVTPVLAAAGDWRCARILGPDPASGDASATFHGRDVFAPAAARLAQGARLDDLGPPLAAPVRLVEPVPAPEPAGARGEVVAVDRFGNLGTNLPGSWLTGAVAVEVAGERVRVARTYGDVEPGEPLALVASDGRVEIAVRDGSAASVLGAGPGTPVRIMATA